MIKNQQWSGITKDDIVSWLSNFEAFDLTNRELVLIYKLLTSIIYFSENDIISLLRDGIKNRLLRKIVLTRQMEFDFQLSPLAQWNIVRKEFNNTCFVPLLDSNAPHESGNYISRELVQQGIINPYQSIFLNDLPEATEKYNFKRIVVIDDCVGSGDQFSDFWEYNAMITSSSELMRTWAKRQGLEVVYLVVFGYKETIEKLSRKFNDIEICCLKILNENLRVFDDGSYIWDNKDERDEALGLITKITKNKGLDLFGHRGLDFAFIMHKTVPDWTLPIFWKNIATEWKCLLRKKNSNDTAI
jgi:hypothetical protein